MVTLMVVTVVTLTLGFLVRFADRRHQHLNVLTLPGIAVVTGLLGWIILQLTGLGYDPDRFWLSWLLPILVSAVLTLGAAWWLGRHREEGVAKAQKRIGEGT